MGVTRFYPSIHFLYLLHMKSSINSLIVTLVLVTSFFQDCFSQNQPDFGSLEYHYVGPTRGGRATTVTGVHGQDHVFYMGTTGGGLWKTTDYGQSWHCVSDGYFKTPAIGAVRVAQNDPNIIYAGTGSDGLRSNIISGKGVYKSIDAGKSWQHIGLEATGHIGAVEIHPQNHNIAFVAAIGQAFQANKARGIFRTKDGGQSWEKVLYLSDTTGFADLEMMPSNPNILYAAAWRAERKPWTIISGGKESGIYKSVDGGDSWLKVGRGLPDGVLGKIDLAVSAADSRRLYALVEAPGDKGGLYRSDDQGESFTQVSDDNWLMHRPFYFCNVDADPQDADVVYVNGIRFGKSTNGGKSWSYLQTPHGDHHDMWINPHNSQLMIQSNDGGANVSHNGGKTWSHHFNQPTAELYQVEVDNQYPYWLYAGQQDNSSTLAVPSIPPHGDQLGGAGYIIETGGCETGPAVPHPEKHHIVYSNCKGRFSVYNKVSGQEKRYDVGAANMYGHNPKDLKFRFQRVSPIHISPHDPNVVYHCSQFVHKSTDEGKSWEIISPDLTAFEASRQVISGSPITRDITGEEFYSTIYAIQESKKQAGIIWVGANDGPVSVTQDGGKSWARVTPKSLPKGGRVDCVEPSPHDAQKAYFTILRYQVGDWKPYIFKTNDLGKSWKKITKGIPNDYPVRVVREDPDREGLLYAGTEYGMFISFDDGENWQPFQQNLPVTPITDIKIHRQDLVLSTMGRGFWILPNLSPLHQQYEAMQKEELVLFTPSEAIRYRYSLRSGPRYPFPVPAYAPPGAVIDYYVKEGNDENLILQILDEAGQVIRSFSQKAVNQRDTTITDMGTGIEINTVNSQLKHTAGLHRIRWDMCHHGAWHPSAGRRYGNGPMAKPGTYTVRLIRGDQTLEKSFQLKADPRVIEQGVSLEDIASQEALALQVVDLLSTARKMLPKADKKTKAKLDQAKGRYTQPQLIQQIEYLYGILNRADQAPGQDAVDRYAELKNALEELK